MTSLDIDSAVLAVTKPYWRRMSAVIAKAAESLGPELAEGAAGYTQGGKDYLKDLEARADAVLAQTERLGRNYFFA